MEKYKHCREDREVFPKDVEIIISIEKIIDNITKEKTFKSIYQDTGLENLCPNDFNKYDFNYGNFKEYLESRFTGIRRVNTLGMVPSLIIWKMTFEPLKIDITKNQAFEFLSKNYIFYKDRIKNIYDDKFKLTENLYYDLGQNKFTNYI